MSSVLDSDALEQSPLADLHLLANELGVDGFRRLRKPELIDAIIARQSGVETPSAGDDTEEAAPPKRARRSRAADKGETETETEVEADAEVEEEGATDEDAPARGR